MAAIDLKAWIRFLSGLAPRLCHFPREQDKSSLDPPFVLEMVVERPPSARRGLSGPPTRLGSWSEDSLEKVRHSDVSSTEWASKIKPHSEQMVSPAEWSNTISVNRLQSGQYESSIFSRLLSVFFFFWSLFNLIIKYHYLLLLLLWILCFIYTHTHASGFCVVFFFLI